MPYYAKIEDMEALEGADAKLASGWIDLAGEKREFGGEAYLPIVGQDEVQADARATVLRDDFGVSIRHLL